MCCSDNLKKNLRIWFLCITAIFLIIALPTYLCGCQKTLQPNCMRYFISNVTIVNHVVNQEQCSECIIYQPICTTICTKTSCSTSCYNSCIDYNYYVCYNSYAIGEFYHRGKYDSCAIGVSTENVNEAQALHEAYVKYPNGTNDVMYIDKNTLTCHTKNNVETLAIVGFIFFMLAGLVIVIWICVELWL